MARNEAIEPIRTVRESMPRFPEDNVNRLLGLLQSYAPTGHDQERCATFLWQMQGDGCNHLEQMRGLAGALYDGLAHGNWPWVIDPEGRF